MKHVFKSGFRVRLTPAMVRDQAFEHARRANMDRYDALSPRIGLRMPSVVLAGARYAATRGLFYLSREERHRLFGVPPASKKRAL